MTLYQILCLIGVPSLIGGVIAYMKTRFKRQREEMQALKLGMQSLLRDRLLQSYRYFSAKGYAEIEDRENIRNMYEQYHALGKNGVMDDVYRRFMELPTDVEANKER